MSMPSEQEMREAITARDLSFDGHFFYGVITTGIFCQPSCSARPAKPENLRFFSNIKAAMLAGFRPCKRCQSTESRVERLVEIARYIEEHADERITLLSLANKIKLSPSRLQRIFKEAFGISPKAYQDAVRMRHFKQSLKEGDGITDAIFSSGFGSISRVYGEASRNIGMTPKAYRAGGAGEIITYACRHTALGFMTMAATDKGVCFVQFGDDEASLFAQLKEEFPNAGLSVSPAQKAPELDAWMEALDQHISKGAPRPDLPLDMRGTAFQVKVWQFLLSIREGDVLSYAELAAQIDKPKAARAVASACARNRIGVLIPCHRILRGDGSLGGYRWGLERKRALLDAERARRTIARSHIE
ncbi:bifunctional DNA-binding transcriptional regulator/O6-methylguanine-DNA methyltransferase Ada [Neptunomonas antarctica]|uniref:methylated-DNA--[protein]-cysteine S-methyltransferase n=1 Tax=Neptunomonas antarctica TaxID=619304 RepID=A0A1N7L687_9GAMM|nr:bifunctional DNA-binding transcriptional regulator/O6-methylguanine-DNA methyltransferase Ada [Neptunomonas antarctica]SIS69296.1 AraC family transcriptional regulator, regulatory protein of adaptative response / methylated-DNA-[protein]-cysteine methyltransferase [Neptunomonas antarctica]